MHIGVSDLRFLTPSTPVVPNCCCSEALASYWSNPPFLFFWHPGALALRTERQSARMSKIKNGGLDLYGKVYSLNGIGGERVKENPLNRRGASTTRRLKGVPY